MIVILLITSVIVLIALLNSFTPNYNWLKSRIEKEEMAYSFITFPNDTTEQLILSNGDTIANCFEWNEFQILLYNEKFASISHISHNYNKCNYLLKLPHYFLESTNYGSGKTFWRIRPTAKIETEHISNCLHTLHNRNYSSRAELDRRISSLQNAHIETAQMVKVPIIGLSFDANYLAIYSGLFISVIYYLLYHARARERKNLTLIFKKAEETGEEKAMLHAYQYLSMQQVLMIPPSIDEFIEKESQITLEHVAENVRKHFQQKLITLFPIVSPIIIWLIVVSYDLGTLDFGKHVNGQLTYIHFGLLALVMYWCLYCFVNCYNEWSKVEKLWQDQAVGVIKKIKGWS